jgi:hypothetical protein
MIIHQSNYAVRLADFREDFCWPVSPLDLSQQLSMPLTANSSWPIFIWAWVEQSTIA